MSLSLWKPKCAWMKYTYNQVRMIIAQIRECRSVSIDTLKRLPSRSFIVEIYSSPFTIDEIVSLIVHECLRTGD